MQSNEEREGGLCRVGSEVFVKSGTDIGPILGGPMGVAY